MPSSCPIDALATTFPQPLPGPLGHPFLQYQYHRHTLQRPRRHRIFFVARRGPLHQRPHPIRNHATQLVVAGWLNRSRNLTTTRRDLPPNGCASAQPSPSSGCGRTNRLPNGAARQLCDVALRRLVWRQPFPHRRIRTVGHSEHASRYDSARQPGQDSPPAGPRAQARRGSPRMDRCRGGRSRLREPPCMRPGARPE